MRTESENEAIHLLAVALLRRRGIAAEQATFDQYADAAEIAAEVVARGQTTEAEMLGGAAVGNDTPDAITTAVLAKFAADGKFVGDLSIDEESFLREAISAEEERERTVVADARAYGTRRRSERTIAAETSVDAGGHCIGCGYHVADFGCKCS